MDMLIFMLILVMSLASFVLTYAGLKSRNLVWALYGVAVGLPPLSLRSGGLWVASGLLAALAFWISKRV